MHINIRKSGQKLQENDIRTFEKILNVNLPTSYFLFLLAYNGGRPTPNYFVIPNWIFGQSILSDFKSIESESNRLSLLDLFNALKNRLPEFFLPIAMDPGGNCVLLSLQKETYGYVYFWDHDAEPEICTKKLEDYPNIYFLYTTFEEFLDNLKEEQDLHVKK